MKKELIGNVIYEYIEKLFPELAPKICGMMVDLPYTELINSTKTLESLEAKVRIAHEMLLKCLGAAELQKITVEV